MNIDWKIIAATVVVIGLLILTGVQFISIRNLESELVSEKSWSVEQGKQIAAKEEKIESLQNTNNDMEEKLRQTHNKFLDCLVDSSKKESTIRNLESTNSRNVDLINECNSRNSNITDEYNELVFDYNNLQVKCLALARECTMYASNTQSWYYGR